jgi:hydrogenase maturation protein HypF
MGLGTIYISGGASVNDIIVKGVDDAIREYGIVLRMHRYAPPGDGCISLGQIYAVLYSELL